ncbi:hypothetical protein PILCRDRAFT_815462 [Piloderma croceum F 1598]|uniref:SB domain-containing protein n=1 Tax=Piloderma croceum (strain F 1598) TaxID=765440 RepID=A0A0C3G5C5_PILCF|nr:hypothetical protein PILCRDRAFT_815462 [Piloderma croceum F 1598]
MVVKAGKYVDVSGRCQIEYIQHWERKSEGCNLSALVEAMQDQFSREPPVYAKPKNSVPVRPQSSQSVNQSSATTALEARSTPSPTIPNNRPVLPPKPGSSTHPAIHARSPSIPTSPNASVPIPQNPALANRPPPPLPSVEQRPPQYISASVPSNYLPQHRNTSVENNVAPPPVDHLLPPVNANSRWSTPSQQTPAYRNSPPLGSFVSPPPKPPQHSGSMSHPPHSLQAYSPPPPPPLPQPSQTWSPAVQPSPRVPNLLDEEALDSELSTIHQASSLTAQLPPRPPNPELLRLHSQIHAKLTSELASLSQAMALDTERLRAHQTDILSGEPAIRDEMARLEAVRDVCRTVAERMRGTVEQGERNVAELKRKGDPEVDELVCSTTIVHNQLINLVAEDNAIEDTIYHLHRALNTGRVDLERFLRTTRVLAEEQFLKRALIEKIQSGMSMGMSSLSGSNWE